MGTPVNITVGSQVWVEDPEVAWIDGEVSKINKQEVVINTINGKTVKAKLSKLYPKDMEAPAGGVDDMTKLSYLHEPGVLQNLKARYELNEIYYAGSAWDELQHIRQAIGFLVIHQKPKKTLDEISHDLCAVLSIQQLYRISTMYWDDKYGTHSVSPDVISKMRVLMTEDSNNAVSSSFLLDDDSSIPFSVDDLSKSMEQIDIVDIEPPPLIREDLGFSFLLPHTD